MKSVFFPAKLGGLLSAEISRGRICWNWWRIEDWYDGSDWFPPDFLNKSQGIKELRGCQQLWKYLQALPPYVLMVAQVGLLFYLFFLCSINAGEKNPWNLWLRHLSGWPAFVLCLVCGLWGSFWENFHGFCPSQNPLKATKNGDVKRTMERSWRGWAGCDFSWPSLGWI